MKTKRRYTMRSESQIRAILKEGEAATVASVLRKHNLNPKTYYEWRKRYGSGSTISEQLSALRLQVRELTAELRHLKRAVGV